MGLRASTQINNDSVYVQLDGTLAMQASLDLGSNTIQNVASPVNGTDAANKNYVDTELGDYVLKTGDTMTGNLAMSSNLVTGLIAPTASGDAARKGYVDTQVAGKVDKGGDTMTGDLDMSSQQIKGLGNPTLASDGANKGYVDQGDADRVATAGDTMTGSLTMSGAQIDMGSSKIVNLADPTNPQDGATKNYVDGARQGLDYKENCRVSPNSAVSFDPTIAAPDSVDGVALSVGDRVLISTHTTDTTNGIWVVDTVGTGSNGVWSRAADADEDSEVTAGLTVWIAEGNNRADTAWALTTDDPITIGTTNLTFVQISGLGQISVTDGLYKSGDTIGVNWGDGLNVTSNTLQVSVASPLAIDGNFDVSITPNTVGSLIMGQGASTNPAWTPVSGDIKLEDALGNFTVRTPGVSLDNQTVKSTGLGVKVGDGNTGEILIGQGNGVDTAFKPISGDATLAADGTLTVTGGLSSTDFVHHEKLNTQVGDATPAAFTTANNFVSGTERVFLNGAQLEATDDYTVSASNEINISAGLVPVSGDRIWIHYQKA